jgi:MFS family permease
MHADVTLDVLDWRREEASPMTDAAEAVPPPKPRFLRARLALLLFLQFAVPGAFVPLFSLWLHAELHFTPVDVGWACATQAVAALLGPLTAGQIADRWWPAERCVAVCGLAAGAVLWLVPTLTSPAAVFWASLGLWLVLGPALTLGTAVCFAHLARPQRDFGPVRLWGTLGWVVPGWLLGTWFEDPAWLAGLRCGRPGSELADAFRLAGLFAVAMGLYALTLPRTPPQLHAPPLGGRAGWGAGLAPLAALRLLRQRSFAVFCAGSLGVCLTMAFSAQATPLLLAGLGIPRPWLSRALTLAQSMEVFTLALLPLLVARLGLRRTMLLGLSIWVVGLAALAIGRPGWLAVGALAAWGVCVCCYLVTGQVFVNSRARGDLRASAQGLLYGVNGVGLLAGNLLVGWVRTWSQGELAPTFLVAAALAGVFALVFGIGFVEEEEGPSGPAD